MQNSIDAEYQQWGARFKIYIWANIRMIWCQICICTIPIVFCISVERQNVAQVPCNRNSSLNSRAPIVCRKIQSNSLSIEFWRECELFTLIFLSIGVQEKDKWGCRSCHSFNCWCIMDICFVPPKLRLAKILINNISKT